MESLSDRSSPNGIVVGSQQLQWNREGCIILGSNIGWRSSVEHMFPRAALEERGLQVAAMIGSLYRAQWQMSEGSEAQLYTTDLYVRHVRLGPAKP